MKKLIAIALVLMLCVSALSISAFAAGTVTVTAEVPADWTAPYCYGWVDGTTNSHWPGVKMTKSGNVWTAEIPADCNRVIINNGQGGGTNQTADLTIVAGQNVQVVVTKSGDTINATVNGQAPAPAPVFNGYFVAGVSGLCGVEWDAGAAANKMTEGADGIWTKTYSGIAAGDYKLKVTDGTWSNSWGGDGADGNYEFSVAEANSTVVVSFDSNSKTVSVTVNGEGGGEPAPAPEFDAYFVAGTAALCNGKEWDAGAAENAMVKGDDGIWSITYTAVPAGEYELKVTAGNWDNCWGNSAGDNVKFSIEEAGDITVKFNPSTGRITVYNGDNPITGDMNLAGVGIALLAATAGLVALVGKKKEF